MESVSQGQIRLEPPQHGECISRTDTVRASATWRVYLRDRYGQRTVRVSALREKVQIKLVISPSLSKLSPGQPDLALTLSQRRLGWQPVLKSFPIGGCLLGPDLRFTGQQGRFGW